MNRWVTVAAAALVVFVAAVIIESTNEPWQTGLTAAGGIVILYALHEWRNGGR